MRCWILTTIVGFILADVKVINFLDPATCPPQLDIVFLLDTSEGADEVYVEEIRWTKALIDNLPIHQDAVRVALLQYSTNPMVEFSLNSNDDKAEAIKKIDLIEFQSGVTKTGAALDQAEIELFSSLKGARANASKIIILFTDGLSIDDPNETASRLRDVKGVNIYVISVDTGGFVPEMQKIAGDADNVFGPSDLSRFSEHLTMDVEASRKCAEPVESLGPIPVPNMPETIEMSEAIRKPKRKRIRVVRRKGKGGTIIKEEIVTRPDGKKVRRIVRRKKHPASTTAIPQPPIFSIKSSSMEGVEGTTTSNMLPRKRVKLLGKTESIQPYIFNEPSNNTNNDKNNRDNNTPDYKSNKKNRNSSNCPMDILFVLDSSGSIGSVYEKQKDFLSSILESVSLQDQSHRVAFIQFAGARLQKMERDFASFKHSDEIIKTFNKLRHFTGTTYIGSALEMALARLESRRKDIPTIVIVLSDGFSHDDVREAAVKIRAERNVELFVGSLAHLSNIPTLLEIAGDESHLFIKDDIEVLKRELLNRLQCRL